MKRILKLAISLGLYVWDRLSDFGRRLVGATPPARCVVLYYHAIQPSERARFAAQMDRVVRGSTPLRGEFTGPLQHGGRYAVVTFDDGFVSVNENALPEMESRGIPATLFVPTGCFGRPPSWVKDPAAPASRERVMTREELLEVSRRPLVTIGSHSITHPRFDRLPSQDALREFVESRSVLGDVCQREITLFSFPHGAHNAQTLGQAREAGYQRVFTVRPTLAFRTPSEAVTGRVLVDPSDWDLEFHLKLHGAYRWMAR
jgi:peptidoglycan/xylan/chitin deacetylase (PgdA/CDA1 family)